MQVDFRKGEHILKLFQQEWREKHLAISDHLKKSEKDLDELISFGDELITNIKISNEIREAIRVANEREKREDLLKCLEIESLKSLANFDQIRNYWNDLKAFKEPISFYEQLLHQKQKIMNLMDGKNEIIDQCQIYISTSCQKLNIDELNQSADINSLVERIDSQLDVINTAHRGHLQLLKDVIEGERQNIKLYDINRWKQFYYGMCESETKKLSTIKKKYGVYNTEVENIKSIQEEITRGSRIRLDRESESLEFQLRTAKYNVLINSEKLDYNYQILQKRNEENVIINNQQKRRVSKMNEAISALRKKIQTSHGNFENFVNRLASDIIKLHTSISDLEEKFALLRIKSREKFISVWKNNKKDITRLLLKVSEIKKILNEKQIALLLMKPMKCIDEINEKKDETVIKSLLTTNLKGLVQRNRPCNTTFISARLQRSIIRKIATHAGFLVEEKLLQLLVPHTEENQRLFRIQNIFMALRLHSLGNIHCLFQHFKNYMPFCPFLKHGDSGKQKYNSSCQSCQQYTETTVILKVLSEYTEAKSLEGVPRKEVIQSNGHGNFATVDLASIKSFWHQYYQIVPHGEQAIWNVLLHGVNHYLITLKRRQKLEEECQMLRKQNLELKYLLQHLYI